ncbi:hypothetical protein CVT24_007433, partial [Panaeolus cyanescens]
KVTATTTSTSANKDDRGTTKTEIPSTSPNPAAHQDSSSPQDSDHSNTQVQEIKNIGQALMALTDAVEKQTQVQQQQLDVLTKTFDVLGSMATSTRSTARSIETMALLKSGLQGIGLKSFYNDQGFASAVMALASEIHGQRGRSVNDNDTHDDSEDDADGRLTDEDSEVQVLVGTSHLRGKSKAKPNSNHR